MNSTTKKAGGAMKESKFASQGKTREPRRISEQSRNRFEMALRVLEAQGEIPTAKGVRRVLTKLTGYGMDTWILLAIMKDHLRHREKSVEGIVREYRRLPPLERQILRRRIQATERTIAK